MPTEGASSESSPHAPQALDLAQVDALLPRLEFSLDVLDRDLRRLRRQIVRWSGREEGKGNADSTSLVVELFSPFRLSPCSLPSGRGRTSRCPARPGGRSGPSCRFYRAAPPVGQRTQGQRRRSALPTPRIRRRRSRMNANLFKTRLPSAALWESGWKNGRMSPASVYWKWKVRRRRLSADGKQCTGFAQCRVQR